MLTFHGDGTGSYLPLRDSGNSTSSGPFSYTVADDGLVTIVGSARGYLSADNATILFADNDISDGILGVMIGIKRAEGAPALIISGGGI